MGAAAEKSSGPPLKPYPKVADTKDAAANNGTKGPATANASTQTDSAKTARRVTCLSQHPGTSLDPLRQNGMMPTKAASLGCLVGISPVPHAQNYDNRIPEESHFYEVALSV